MSSITATSAVALAAYSQLVSKKKNDDNSVASTPKTDSAEFSQQAQALADAASQVPAGDVDQDGDSR